jgi:hypothetical protein
MESIVNNKEAAMRNPSLAQTESTNASSKANLVFSGSDDDDDDDHDAEADDEEDEGITSIPQSRWIQSAGFGSLEWWSR